MIKLSSSEPTDIKADVRANISKAVEDSLFDWSPNQSYLTAIPSGYTAHYVIRFSSSEFSSMGELKSYMGWLGGHEEYDGGFGYLSFQFVIPLTIYESRIPCQLHVKVFYEGVLYG